MARAPQAWTFGLRYPEGGGWMLVGQIRDGVAVHWLTNPRLVQPRAWSVVLGLWRQSQGGMGRGWLPEAGGLRDQPAWLIAAFGVLAAEEARLDKQERAGR